MNIEYKAATLGELMTKASAILHPQFFRQPVKEAGVWSCVVWVSESERSKLEKQS